MLLAEARPHWQMRTISPRLLYLRDTETVFSEQQRSGVLPLKRSLWPRRDGKSLWPDIKTPKELCLSLLLGAESPPKELYSWRVPRVRFTVEQANKDIGLLESILRENLLGIRMGSDVPSKYFGYFRRRWGFLILTSARLPTGLIRYLIGKWITDPYSLWLAERKGFRQFLKSLPETIVSRSRSRADSAEDFFCGDQSEALDSEGLAFEDEIYSDASSEGDLSDDAAFRSAVGDLITRLN